MEGAGPEVTFLMQAGLVRDTVTASVNTLTLQRLREIACDFINKKVRSIVCLGGKSRRYTPVFILVV
ncbi:hypothetical protein B566_EDAN014385 [Ephemera danica]|nr:hypothetical protein B566_EDAN014385 [Ephemera danica]